MILNAIELTYVGPFHEKMRLGPLVPGLNVLCAPNESGKSTAIRAAARALFDRHTTKGDEIKALQPAGTDLAPHVAVEFETQAGRFRIEKTFIHSPRSLLKMWQSGMWLPIAEADLADQRVQALLNSSLPGKGATKPEHWGFLSFLWARQGEPSEWPGLDDVAVGQRIRARLARIELDPVIEVLSHRLAADADSFVTSKGLSKANGPLEIAERDLASIEADLSMLRQTRADLESAQQRFVSANTLVAQLEREHADRQNTAIRSRDQAFQVELLRSELEARQTALATAQEKLTVLAADVDSLAKLRKQVAHTQTAFTKAETTALDTDNRSRQLRVLIDEKQKECLDHENRLTALRADCQRLQSLLKLRALKIDADRLTGDVAKMECAALEITTLESKKAKLPTLSTVKLRKLEELTESIRTLRDQLQVLGLTVEITPNLTTSTIINEGAKSREQSLRAGIITRIQSPQSLDLELSGWGRIFIRSGAPDVQSAAALLAEREASFSLALEAAEVSTLESAREAIAARKELENRIKCATVALSTQLGDHESLIQFREIAFSAQRRVEFLRAAVEPTTEEEGRSLTDLETSEARLRELVRFADETLKALEQRLDHHRAEERAMVKAVQDAAQISGNYRSLLVTLETQIADLSRRYPLGIDEARLGVQLLFTQAEARVAATKTELPKDFEKLPERSKRAAAALQQLTNELLSRRAEADQAKGTLQTLGGQGIYSRETELEEKKVEATLRRDAARMQGWSARIAHELIEYRKQIATKSVLKPLEERLTAAFTELSGVSGREVFLDEHLQIVGLGHTRDSVYSFESLSQGAKEQLLLCLRIAVAQELAIEEPQVLILDDVLVNTDSVRQERILDVLEALSKNLQILLLTCHADRYRGIGTPLKLLSNA